MAKIIIDITRLVGRALEKKIPTGVDRVVVAHIEQFHDRAQALVRWGGRWIVLSPERSQRLFKALLSPPSATLPWMIRWHVGCGYYLDWTRPNRSHLLLNLSHTGLEDPAYVQALKRYNMSSLFFVHDLIPITHPEYSRPEESARHHARLETMIRYGSGLIINSRDTEHALKEYAQQHAWTLPPSVCTSPAPGKLPVASPTPPPVKKPYFVVVGTIEPRKNHLTLLHIWRELVQELGANTPRLVIIGRRGWECEQVVDMLERCIQIQPYITEKSDCDDAELATWLTHARALLFPTFVEGYGLPPVESLMLGVPVIASDLPVFREAVGNIPEYLHPLDALGWKRMIIAYAAENSPEHTAQRQRMQGFARPTTWQQHCEQVEAFIRTLGEPM